MAEDEASYTFPNPSQYIHDIRVLGPPVPLPFPPLPPSEFFARRHEFYNTLFRRGRSLPPPTDTPFSSLYRMYEYILNDLVIGYRNEIEYFCNKGTLPIPKPGDRGTISWLVRDIPDPCDPDPARYAVLAGITHFLVSAFNRRIGDGLSRDRDTPRTRRERERCGKWWAPWRKEYGLPPLVPEEVPVWAKVLPPLDEALIVPYWVEGEFVPIPPDSLAKPEVLSQAFTTYNIFMFQPDIHFI